MKKNIFKFQIAFLSLSLLLLLKVSNAQASEEAINSQEALSKITASMAEVEKNICQENINEARNLINSLLTDNYRNTYSSALDLTQQKLMIRAIDECNKAKQTQNLEDAIRARKTLEDIKLVENNDGVKNWILVLEKEFVSGLTVPANVPAAITMPSKSFLVDDSTYYNDMRKFGNKFLGKYDSPSITYDGFASLIDVYGNPIKMDDINKYSVGSHSTRLNLKTDENGFITSFDLKYLKLIIDREDFITTPITVHVTVKNSLIPTSVSVNRNIIETQNDGVLEDIFRFSLGFFSNDITVATGNYIQILDQNGTPMMFSKYSLKGDRVNEQKDLHGNVVGYDVIMTEMYVGTAKNLIKDPITFNVRITKPTSLRINSNVVTLNKDIQDINAPYNLLNMAIFGFNSSNTGRPGAISVLDGANRVLQEYSYTSTMERLNDRKDANGNIIGFDVLVKNLTVFGVNLVHEPLKISVNISTVAKSLKIIKDTIYVSDEKRFFDPLFGRDSYTLNTNYDNAALVAFDEYDRPMPFIPLTCGANKTNIITDSNGKVLSYDLEFINISNGSGQNLVKEPFKIHVIMK